MFCQMGWVTDLHKKLDWVATCARRVCQTFLQAQGALAGLLHCSCTTPCAILLQLQLR
jgi:hypothetical protein